MKRYLAFAYPTYYPSGGWGDFVGDFDTLKEAQSRLKDIKADNDHFQVIDLETSKVVFDSQKRGAY